MKRRINLLSINFTKRELSEVIGGFRLKALIILVILVIAAVGEFFVHLYLQNEIKTYNLSENTLEQYVDTNKNFEDKLKFFFYKYNLLKTYLAEDANGYEYYTQVQNLIAETAPTAQLTAFSYKNSGETSFTLSFDNYEEASDFIETLETPVFLDIFQFVKLEGFDASDRVTSAGFTITVNAQFLDQDAT